MVYILLADGFEEAEALVPADLLRRAGVDAALVAVRGRRAVGAHGIAVEADLSLDRVDPLQAEMVVLPGGMGGVNGMKAEPAVAELVRAVEARGGWLAAICAAPTLLAEWGLLAGKRAVCYPGMEEQLTGAVAQPEQSVVVEGKLVTARAAGSAFDFGLTLIEVLSGAEEAQEVRHAVHY